MGNTNKQNVALFDYKQFYLMMRQQQQNQVLEQENSSQQLLNQFKCVYESHNDKQIEGMCVNEDCKAENRRTCFDCINQRIHERDQQSQQRSNQPQNADQLKNLITSFTNALIKEIDLLEYFLYIQELELIHQDEKIALIIAKALYKLEIQINHLKGATQQINIKDYIEEQYKSNMGIIQYFQYFYKRILEIHKDEEKYLFLKNNQNEDQQQIEVKDIELFQEIKKKKLIIINKITETQQYTNKKINEEDQKLISQSINDIYEQGKILQLEKQYALASQCYELQIQYNKPDCDSYFRIGNTYDGQKKISRSYINV